MLLLYDMLAAGQSNGMCGYCFKIDSGAQGGIRETTLKFLVLALSEFFQKIFAFATPSPCFKFRKNLLNPGSVSGVSRGTNFPPHSPQAGKENEKLT